MQPKRGRILLPAPGWQRFRLSDLPADRPRARRSHTGWGWGLCGWSLFSAVCFWISEPFVGWAMFEQRAPVEAKAPVTVTPTLSTAALPVAEAPRTVVGLVPRARLAPLAHQSETPSWGVDSSWRAQAVASEIEPDQEQTSTRSKQLREFVPETRTPDLRPKSQPESRQAPLREELPAPEPERMVTAYSGPGCERARDEHVVTLDVSQASVPDLPSSAFAGVLEDFDRYRGCDLSRPREISICVAVLGGRAKGVTVKTRPADARLAGCIAAHVAKTKFPSSPHLDLVRTELIVR